MAFTSSSKVFDADEVTYSECQQLSTDILNEAVKDENAPPDWIFDVQLFHVNNRNIFLKLVASSTEAVWVACIFYIDLFQPTCF